MQTDSFAHAIWRKTKKYLAKELHSSIFFVFLQMKSVFDYGNDRTQV